LEDDLTNSRKEAEELEEKFNQAEVDWQMRYNYMENELNNTIDEGIENIKKLENKNKESTETISG
jgi:hypothetical protein